MNSPATLPSMPSMGKKMPSSRIVRRLKAFLEMYATRKVLLSYLGLEIFVDTLFLLYWWFFPQVAYLSRWYSHWWFGHAFSCVLRIGAASCGVYGVFTRKLQSVRLWFLLFLFSGLLMAISVVCVLRLRCYCDNYADCQALRAFSSSSQPMHIKETPPTTRLAWASSSPVRVAASPSSSPETLETFLQRHGQEEEKSEDAASPSLLERALRKEQDEENEGAGSAAGRSSNNKSNSNGNSDGDAVDGEERVRARARNGTSIVDLGKLDEPRRKEGAQQILAWFRSIAARDGEEFESQTDTGLLDRFYAAPDGIAWLPGIESSHNSNPCTEFSLTHQPLAAYLLQQKLEEVRQAKWQTRSGRFDLGHPSIRKELESCFETSKCRSISVFIDILRQVKICKEIGNFRAIDSLEEAVEALGEGKRPAPQDLQIPFSISFRRKFLSEKAKSKSPLYELDLKSQKDPVEGMTLLYDLYKSACVCDADDNFNCQREKYSYHSSSYWCWVAQSSVRNCLENNIGINFDMKKGKYWTSDLCGQTCSCSGLGMMPPKQESVADKMLYDNKLNWGESCGEWNSDGGKSWCFVGFDSPCADRRGAGTYGKTNPAISSMPLQYKSELPCMDEQQQSEAKDTARFRCSIGRFFVWSGLCMQMLSRFVVIFLIHIFISKRCTDHIKVEEQFEVTFSDEDMDGDWDLDEEGSAGGKDKKDDAGGDAQDKADPGMFEDDEEDEDDDRPKKK
mmetsp:Transcript_70104/g.146623  ORF Transcript_70104/g.146623 Transcript_70104/m.146623 type:complete len:734 (+) Transcript_70104:302-2503(+)|eukprot:CAMPEP_0206434064 /NCGR_PEP_ID=MMETSP0324_2-20121206/8915_1 /ASSEMBLY_ACC=CAM_ASM_000836 /TAXON_ID=2866 /ORGANISM="Crypthecodinium cohnii, Strain Seligo" /LENGTH=733 /DNA_ID=CAMNT_0053900467 /DNA_START=238 /DNA_END=2439 /DNA_ORIENTATION=-